MASEPHELLSRISERFVDQGQGSQAGWGQFLDAPKGHQQVGIYGTCAGLVALWAAGQGSVPTSIGARETLIEWWENRDRDINAAKRLAQNLRLALIVLTLRVGGDSGDSVLSEVGRELTDRQLESGGWGNWWIDDSNYDESERLLTTSICLLALGLFNRSWKSDRLFRGSIERGLDFLQSRLSGLSGKSLVTQVMAVLAISALQPRSLAKVSGLRRTLEKAGRSSLEPYFFFYQYRTSFGGFNYAQDYLLIPLPVVAGLAGILQNRSSVVRIQGLNTQALIEKEIDKYGVYRGSGTGHESSMDQLWVVLYLRALHEQSGMSGAPWWARLWYWLIRERRPSIWTDKVWPIFVLGSVTILDILVPTLELARSSSALVVLALGSLLAGLRYGRQAKHIFEGRSR